MNGIVDGMEQEIQEVNASGNFGQFQDNTIWVNTTI